MSQNYKNHKRFYIPHHFIFLPMLVFLLGFGVSKIFKDDINKLAWMMFSVVIFCILYLTLMLRQHYALGNQNRIVRLEFRLRYFELFQKPSSQIEALLSFGQIAALRFAPDVEFMDLLDRCLKENLKGDDIKKLIKNWKADHMRL